jgi:histidinol phosphatase-like PHP family hydrolase
MTSEPSRREVLFLGAAASLCLRADTPFGIPVRDGVPRVDYHAHPEEGLTVERAVALSRERGVKFGLVEHAGVKEGPASKLTGNDDELRAWIRSLKGQPVFAGIQAEHLDWMKAFSKDLVAQLDYVLSDALTMPDKSGKLVKLWTGDFRCGDPRDFMDRYVDFHVEVMAREPVDILANPTFLPEMLQPDFDKLWTERRMRTVVEAAKKYGVAIEINSRYQVPRLPFLQMAKDAGLRFSFGSNMHTAEGIGNIGYCVGMYRKLGLKFDRFFRPAPPGKKPVETRTLA